jgi:hypothetical protein
MSYRAKTLKQSKKIDMANPLDFLKRQNQTRIDYGNFSTKVKSAPKPVSNNTEQDLAAKETLLANQQAQEQLAAKRKARRQLLSGSQSETLG